MSPPVLLSHSATLWVLPPRLEPGRGQIQNTGDRGCLGSGGESGSIHGIAGVIYPHQSN